LLFQSISVNAIPVFARQYSLQCVTCHTRQPALNGFRLSKDEITALDKSSDNEIDIILLMQLLD